MWSVAECLDQIKRLEKMKEEAAKYVKAIEDDIKIWKTRQESVVRSRD